MKNYVILKGIALAIVFFGFSIKSSSQNYYPKSRTETIYNCDYGHCYEMKVTGDTGLMVVLGKEDSLNMKTLRLIKIAVGKVKRDDYPGYVEDDPYGEQDSVVVWKYGYIDSNKKATIPIMFDAATSFRGQYAVVNKLINTKEGCPDQCYHIRKNGTPLYKARFCSVSDFINGYAYVEATGRYDFYHIDTTGKRIYPQTYLYACPYNKSGFALMQKQSGAVNSEGDIWVIIDTKGRELCYYRGKQELAVKYFNEKGYLKKE